MHQETRTAEPWPGVKTLRLLVVESQALLASMLVEVLSAEPGFRIVGTAGTAAEALIALREPGVDVVMLDLMLPDRGGLELIREITAREAPPRVVVCSATHDPAAITMAFGLGAHAFVEKTCALPELVGTLRRAARGEHCLTSRAAEVLGDHARGAGATRLLEPGDLAVLRRLALREHVRDIAAAIRLSPSGVYKVRQRIARMSGARTKDDFHAFAVKLGLVPRDAAPRDPISPRRPAPAAPTRVP
jgi:two-component system invasion response regulator UvrY